MCWLKPPWEVLYCRNAQSLSSRTGQTSGLPQIFSYLLDLQPPPLDHWQGRQTELATLEDWLREPSVRLVGIGAAGGYGKSALAAKLLAGSGQAPADQPFEQILWAGVNQPLSFGVWSREVLRLLGAGDIDASRSDAQVITFGVNFLAQRRCLVVVDNVESLLGADATWHDPAYGQFWAQWLERGQGSTFVLTSRERPTLPPELPLERSRWYTLRGLAVPAGVELLKSLGIDGTQAELTALVTVADGHPLLLRLMAGWLRNPRQHDAPRATYALDQDDVYRLQQIVGLHRGDPEASVAKVLAATVARVAPEQRQLWQALSVYRGAFGLGAAQAQNATTTLADLYELVDRSLLQELPSQRFEWLALVQRFAQQQSPDLVTAHRHAAAFYQAQLVPLSAQTPAIALAPYLSLFHHLCELGDYGAAWGLMQQRTVNDPETGRYSACDMFLKFQGSGSDRLALRDLYERLAECWQPNSSVERKYFGDTLQAIGDVLQFLKQSREALERYSQALGIYRDVGDRLGEANTLKAIGDVLQFLKQSREALERYDQALGIYRDVGDRLGEANTLKAIGDVLQFLKQSREALERYDQALGIYRDVGDRLGEANTLKAIGDVLQFLDQRSEALERYDQALGIYRDVGDRLGEANTLKAIGDVLQFLDQRSEALERYDQALGIYRDVGDRLGEANTLKAIGDVLQFLKQSREALERYDQALGIYRDVGDRLGEANTLKAIGDVLQFLKQSREALERYDQALGIYHDVGDRLGEANTLKAIGDVLQFLKQSREALERYDQALGIYRDVGARLGEANTLKAIGDVLQFLKQSREALERYDQALGIYRDVGDRLGEANTLKAIGDVLQFLKQSREALERYDQALGIYRDVGARLGEANVLCELGRLQAETDAEQAMAQFLAAQTIYETIGDRYSQGRNLLMFIVQLQIQQGDVAGAMQSLDAASAIGRAIDFEPFCDVAAQIRAGLEEATS
jgi:tetratricopeptide (TPR) repeat protein